MKKIGDLIQGPGMGKQINKALETARLVEMWPEVVGYRVAKHTEVMSVRRGVLVVKADGHGWAQELTLLKPKIMERVQVVTGFKINDIRFNGQLTTRQ